MLSDECPIDLAPDSDSDSTTHNQLTQASSCHDQPNETDLVAALHCSVCLLRPGIAVSHGRFLVTSPISYGGFGQVWRGIDCETEQPIVIKICALPDSATPENASGVSLALEATLLLCLEKTGAERVPRLLLDGLLRRADGCLLGYLVLPFLGPDLATLITHLPNAQLTPYSAMRVAEQLLLAVRELHDRGWLHRDIKPSNVCLRERSMSRMGECEVVLIDMGLATVIHDQTNSNRLHNTPFIGTTNYSSLSAHYFKQHSVRDDLWSWLYSLGGLLAALPWANEPDRDKVAVMKTEIFPNWIGQWPELCVLYNTIRPLQFHERPDYDQLQTALGLTDRSQPLDWQKS